MPEFDFEEMFNEAPLPAYILQDGVFRLANKAMAGITGYSAGELPGTPFTWLCHPDDSPGLINVVKKLLDGGEHPVSHNFRGVNKQGDTLLVKTYLSRIEFDGRPAVLGQVIDETRQSLAEEKLLADRHRFFSVLNELPAVVYLQSPDYTIPFANRLLRERYGDPEGRFCYDIFHGRKTPCEICRTFRVFKTGRTQKREKFRESDGGVFEVYDYPFWDVDGSPLVLELCINITERKQVERALQESEARLRRITDNMLDLISQTDIRGKYLYVSPSHGPVLGYKPEYFQEKTIFDFLHPEDLKRITEEFYNSMRTSSSGKAEYRFRHADGRYLWLETVGNPLFDDSWSVTGAIFSSRDITRRKQAEEEAVRQKAYFQQLFESSPEAIVILGNNNRIINANKGFKQLFDYSIGEIKGKLLNDVIVPGEFSGEAAFLFDTVSGGQVVQREAVRKRRDGTLVDVSILGFPIVVDGKQAGIYAIYSDISERKQAVNKLTYYSMHDQLTGLYNRTFFERKMRELAAGAHMPFGIIVCDVDGLKLINDTMGHDAGDALLKAAAMVVKKCFRQGDTVARIGGDEFAVLLLQSGKTVVENAVLRIRAGITGYNETNPELPLSISVGFAIAGGPGANPGDIFKEADNNMYREKLHRSRSARSAIVKTLMKALEARDFITEGHADRLQDLVAGLAVALGLSRRRITDLRLLAKFHDIGKVGVPDRILFKPGPLTPEEFAEMRLHCEIGHRIALSAQDLAPIADWVLKHHEWWNGQGYPLGLKGEEIPLECRILAIADAYDAMTSDRPYRKAMPSGEALKVIKSCSGTQFDPYLVKAFEKNYKIFEEKKGIFEKEEKNI
ncbi:adenylate/guanylate cyclase [Desulfocucumis palustris]|uniref:Adenylate/guanylate cyclase n=1 Tax=Desulfocucumis palustris TaxID=1898651 RepID=A0A2L2XDI3_9FIRM|nr:PAS domain S-box protein [Desulfocucumis palustris]GBF34298.1 adenylate/guanylate cyclase [Desulfocucumis palustris]